MADPKLTNPENSGVGRGNAPQQLANLKPIYGTDRARELQKKSVESRMKNKEVREAIKATAKDWKILSKELGEDLPPAIDILRVQMMAYLQEDKIMEAAELAKVLAEYEQPKLSRIDSIVGNFDAEGLSDEELEAELSRLRK